jgi:hypothetical protein
MKEVYSHWYAVEPQGLPQEEPRGQHWARVALFGSTMHLVGNTCGQQINRIGACLTLGRIVLFVDKSTAVVI